MKKKLVYKDGDLISLKDAAAILHVHPETLRRWDKSGELKAIRTGEGGHRKYSIENIDELIRQSNHPNNLDIIRQRSLFSLDTTYCHEVDSFPESNIPVGATYTFTPETAKNVTEWTHGLHIYPAKFIPQIPRWSFSFSKINRLGVVLDPLCGCGTTMVEAAASGFNSYGIDVNPIARLISKAKITLLYTDDHDLLWKDVDDFVKYVQSNNSSCNWSNLHPNWEFWFPRHIMEQLLRIKNSIDTFSPFNRDLDEVQIEDIRDFYRACFSSIIKQCSFFDEGEIKVRRDTNKTLQDIPSPIELINTVIKTNLEGLTKLSKQMQRQESPFAQVIGHKAQDIPLQDASVDLIITSPAYLNAVDYPMTHKYSMFILDLISPDRFKEHCREYSGITERAVRQVEYTNIPYTGFTEIDSVILSLSKSASTVDKIRGYIVAQYFIEMTKALKECYRVLKPNSYCIFVVGDNVIRKEFFPTSSFLQEIATSRVVGFELITFFFHQLRNIRLKKQRNATGGLIKKERVIILKKPS